MTIAELQQIRAIPENWTPIQKALWYDYNDEWTLAHDMVDQLNDVVSAHVHAYLHRKEGDLWNANYWYTKAKKPTYKGSLASEWEQLFNNYFNTTT